ncbi:MAG: hypothetical protein AVDCRST_MAG04-1030, partial [uncultured Acetobacteraceae bacterium]
CRAPSIPRTSASPTTSTPPAAPPSTPALPCWRIHGRGPATSAAPGSPVGSTLWPTAWTAVSARYGPTRTSWRTTGRSCS